MDRSDDNKFSKISFFVFFILMIVISVKMVSGFVLATIAGGLLAQVLRPLFNFLNRNRVNRKLSACLILTIFVVVIIFPLFFFTQSLIVESGKFAQLIISSEISFDSVVKDLSEVPVLQYFVSDPTLVNTQFKSIAKIISASTGNFLMYLVAQIPMLLIDVTVILLSFIVFILNSETISKFFSNLIPIHKYIKRGLMQSSNNITKVAFVGSVVAGAGQAVAMAISYLFLGIPNIFLASGSTFILSFIPLIGAVPVWVAGACYLLFKGYKIKMVLMIILGLLIGVLDNVIRVVFLKESKNNLHPFIGLITVMGGIQMFGLLGVLVGPIVAALLLSMCEMWPTVLAQKKLPEEEDSN